MSIRQRIFEIDKDAEHDRLLAEQRELLKELTRQVGQLISEKDQLSK